MKKRSVALMLSLMLTAGLLAMSLALVFLSARQQQSQEL